MKALTPSWVRAPIVGEWVQVKENHLEPSHGWGSTRRGDCGTIVSIEGDGPDRKFYINFATQDAFAARENEIEICQGPPEGRTAPAPAPVRDAVSGPMLEEGVGCHDLTGEAECTAHVDGRALEVAEGGQAMRGEPCVWCCGMACTRQSANLCEPRAWLNNQPDYVGQGRSSVEDSCKSCASIGGNWISEPPLGARIVVTVRQQGCGGSASSRSPGSGGRVWPALTLSGSAVTAADAETGVVSEDGTRVDWLDGSLWTRPPVGTFDEGRGCHQITDKDSCTSHVDGRAQKTKDHFGLGTEPCVWCCGEACTSNGNVCEPYHWVVNQLDFSGRGTSSLEDTCRPALAPP